MTANEYQNEALRTAPKHDQHVEQADRCGPESMDLLHAAIGVGTEAGELLDAIKKHVIYGRPLNYSNVAEELGDLLWYIALAADAAGFTLEDVMSNNVEKLTMRYPEAFNEEDAARRADKTTDCGSLDDSIGEDESPIFVD